MRTLQGVIIATAVVTGVAVTAAPGFAQAQQKFPSKPVRIVVPFSAGAPTDIMARLIGSKMSENWAQPVVVDNPTGGAARWSQHSSPRPRPMDTRSCFRGAAL